MKLSIVASKEFPDLPGFSGIEYHDHQLFVISDSTSLIYVFDTEDLSLLKTIHLAPNGSSILPKAKKNDLESMCFLDNSNEQLLIIGSGSKAGKRDKGYLVNLKTESIVNLNLYNFYESLATQTLIGGRTFLNIESLHVVGNELYLGQRGNTNDSNCFIITDKQDFIESTKRNGIPKFTIKPLKIPKYGKIAGGLSGASFIDENLYLIATYEETDNTYDDGKIYGSKLLVLNDSFKLTASIDFPVSAFGNFMKIESICKGPKSDFFAVADQDENGSSILRLHLIH